MGGTGAGPKGPRSPVPTPVPRRSRSKRHCPGSCNGGLLLGGPARGSEPGGRTGGQPGGGDRLAVPARPGKATNPCAYSLTATTVTAAGTLKPATWPRSALASKFDCFYVHPTDSLAKTANTGLAVTKVGH